MMFLIEFLSKDEYNQCMANYPKSIMFDEGELEKITELAKRCGITFSEFVRLSVRFGSAIVLEKLELGDDRMNVIEKTDKSQ